MSKLSVYLLNTEECHTLNQRLLDIFQSDFSSKSPEVAKFVPYLKKLDSDLSKILSNLKVNSLTEQLVQKDRLRDNAFIGFRDYVKAFLRSSDETKVQAAVKLEELIQQLGWTLYDESYAEQTALMRSLIERLEAPEYTAALNVIGAQTWFRDLKKTNEDFEKTIKLRDEQKSQQDIPLSSETKEGLNEYLKPLLEFIKVMAKIEPVTYAGPQAKIEEIVGNIMSIARSRRTRKGNDSEEIRSGEAESQN